MGIEGEHQLGDRIVAHHPGWDMIWTRHKQIQQRDAVFDCRDYRRRQHN